MFTRRPRSARAPAPTKEPPAAAETPRDQARALLSMLETGTPDPQGQIPADRLRDLARDLIARVESREAPAERPDPSPAGQPHSAPQPAIPTPRPALFRTPQPFAAATLAQNDGRPAPKSASPSPEDLPTPISATPSAAAMPDTKRAAWVRKSAAVRRLVLKAFRPEDAVAEHPVILALDLVGRPPREQAERLRRVPPGRVRATHRYLVELERSRL